MFPIFENCLHELENWIVKINWDILGLWEVRREGKEYIDLASGHVLYYRGKDDGETCVETFVIHKGWKNWICHCIGQGCNLSHTSVKKIQEQIIHV